MDKDPAEAFRLYSRPADQNNAGAACAASWFDRSAQRGNQYAQYTPGDIYLKGEAVGKDMAKVSTLLAKSAGQSNANAA